MACDLEQKLYKSIEEKTPDYIKKNKIIDINNNGAFKLRIKKEHLLPYDEENNPLGLNLNDWLKSYKNEATVSTAGIRGPQNILYPYDTRFPINLVGVALATHAKALVAAANYPEGKLVKIAAGEVRYNTDMYLDLIARIQAAQGIKTLVPSNRSTIPIWMASFLAFKLDLLGGEYITSSHGISIKNATKDLNSQGSQYLPEESLEFVDKILDIFKTVEKQGYYDIDIAAKNDPLVDESFMSSINDGVDLYEEYLRSGVANDVNLNLIKGANKKIVVENVGGSAYRTLSRLLSKLDLAQNFVWFNKDEDPFFHSIGKYGHDPKGNKCFYDYSVDAAVVSKNKQGESYFPVIETMNYPQKLREYPLHTVVLITDPDHDRLTVTQIESADEIPRLKKTGVDYVVLDGERVLTVFSANQSFLLIMDFWMKQLKTAGVWDNHPRFIIKTTASARSWDEWAKYNGIKVVNVPVGFKEIANVMKKVEKQIAQNPQKDVVITDVFAEDIILGKNPRLVFAGEESGGMILGAESFVTSKSGRLAVAMREKSASEAVIVASALCSTLEKDSLSLSGALESLFITDKIIAKYDIREDISYYNESEPDIEKMKREKIEGEKKRTKNDIFYLTLALAFHEKKLDLEQVKEILTSTFPDLNFDNLTDIKFVGDGTYMQFEDKFVEIRPSGTDAKTKAYSSGKNKDELEKYARLLGRYSGSLNETCLKYLKKDCYNSAKTKSMQYYLEFTNKDINSEKFVVPDYKDF